MICDPWRAMSQGMGSSRRTGLTEADRALWTSYARRIKPLAGRDHPKVTEGSRPAIAPPASPRQVAAARVGHAKLPPLAVGEQPGGVDSATWQRFRTGRLPAARVLDLHGHTAQHAFNSLAAFVRVARAEGLRCVEVVTGQGGVLRRELPLWLNLPEFRGVVLAAAHPHAANQGAVRLLLRRVR
jgi:DNA-nicking Smr family endonuclease